MSLVHKRHTWTPAHCQAGTNCDELKDLGGWKLRVNAKFGTEHLTVAAGEDRART